MKRKFIIVVMLITLFCSVNLSAISIGPELGFVGSHHYYGGNLGLSIKMDQAPVVFTITPSFGSSFGSGWFGLGFAADYWFLNPKITDIDKDVSVNWYIGLGGMAAAYFHRYYYVYDTEWYTEGEIGVRVPVGVNFFVQKWIEPYIQLAPTIGLYIYDTDYSYSHDNKVGFGWQIPLSIGCRFKL